MTPTRREEDINGTSLSGKLDRLEDRMDRSDLDVAERDRKNRADIHTLKNGQQVTMDQQRVIMAQLSEMRETMAPWTGATNLLKEIRDEQKQQGGRLNSLETAHAVTVGVSKSTDKSMKNRLTTWGIILGILTLLATLLPVGMDSCNKTTKTSQVETHHRTTDDAGDPTIQQ